jgi:hypothetical protein
MNCQDFKEICADLARGVSTDQPGAKQHAAECEQCSGRLRKQQLLSDRLTAGAAADATSNASAHLETALLAAFNGRRKTDVEQVAVLPAASAGSALRWMAIAAVLLLALSAAALWLNRSRSNAVRQAEAVRVEEPSDQVSKDPETPQELREPRKSTKPPDRKNDKKPRPRERRERDQPDIVFAADARDRSNEARKEVVTNFIPLVHESALDLESGQLMRVELPPSALVSLGFPVSLERSDRRIKADVMVGYDGVARAIRFVK